VRNITKAIGSLFLAILGVLIWNRYGFVGLLIAMPIALAMGYIWAIAKTRWARRGGM